MAAKKNLANFANSNALKTAMVAKAIYPDYRSDDVCYDGSVNDIHLLHGQADDGSFRTVNFINNNPSFDWVEPNDPALVRAWTVKEIERELGKLSGFQTFTSVLNGSTYTFTITFNGVNYSRSAANEANAAAPAFTDLVNAL
jgi:hypothetical protein